MVSNPPEKRVEIEKKSDIVFTCVFFLVVVLNRKIKNPSFFNRSMASLQISGSVRFEPLVGSNRSRYLRPIGSLGFPRFRRRFSIGRPLLLRRSSFSGEKISGSGESENDDKGFMIDAERDGSGSVLGFQLIPPGTFSKLVIDFFLFIVFLCIFANGLI